MNTETEIKLRVSADTLQQLTDHPLLRGRLQGEWQTVELFNQYFDSADGQLAAARVALRLRRDGDAIIQTLKTRGNSVAGLSERNEWDWHLQQPQLDLSLLTDECWPAALAGMDLDLLQPLFTTDFRRVRGELRWEREGVMVCVEAALDSGRVVAGAGEDEICELELELREGPAEAVLELALALAADVPLMPCDISKAERGYRLLQADSYQLRLPAVDWQATAVVDEVIEGLGWQLLGNSQRLAEQYRHLGQWRLFRELTGQLADLRALFGVFDLGLPRSSAQPFTGPLDALLAQLRPLVLSGWADDEHGRAARDAAPALFAELLAQPAWGQLFVGLALWLRTRGWTQGRPPRGNKVGNLELPRWLLAACAREVHELQVPHANDDDVRVAECIDQMPRLGRLHLLLGNLRHRLEAPEADRLFGELNKLQALLEQLPQVDAESRPLLLAALRKQGTRVRRLDAWRVLNS